MKTLKEELKAPLDEVDRWWIRKPVVIMMTLIIIPLGAIVGICEATYNWYKQCW